MPPSNPGPADYQRALAAAGLEEIAVFHRQRTGSTSDDARNLPADTGLAVVIAEEQTRGRGRGTNAWFSPRGSISLTISAPGVDASRLAVLPLGVGAAVAGALRALGAPAEVKWPNDVLVDGRKVCGILCESSLMGGSARVFIGIGINAGASALPPEASSHSTSLAAEGLAVDRPALVADITARVVALLRGSKSAPEVVAEWKALSAPWWGEMVTALESGATREVTLVDVSPEGHLVVRDAAGGLRSLVAGEVRRIRRAEA